MATKVHMEALSPTMEEGQVVKWHKAEGDRVSSGEVLAVLPFDWLRLTDTTTSEFTELARRAKAELGATALTVVVSGTVTDAATAALAAAGWRR